MKALVTGGAGFIGSNIVEKLLKQGHTVIVLDNLVNGKKENLSFVSKYSSNKENFRFIQGDIRDLNLCCTAAKDIDVIFHQAALRSVPKSLEDPYEYNDVNITGTLNMLNAAKENKVKRFVFASSSSVYGETTKFPEKENDDLLLICPYALTKLTGEYYCRIFSENFGIETVALRYFNVFGPRQAVDDEYSVVIPKFIQSMLNDQQPPIHGDGQQSRDFVFVENVVDANLLAATKEGVSGLVVNIASGQDSTILSLVEILNQIMGKQIKPTFTPIRAGDVLKTLADISKAESALGYKPKLDFAEGLKKTVESWKNK